MNETKSFRKSFFTVAPWVIIAVVGSMLYQDHQRRAAWEEVEKQRAIEKQAVTELGKLGGYFNFDPLPRFRVTAVTFIATGGIVDGEAVINKPTIADDDLKHLTVLTKLEELQLTADGFTNAGLEHLQGLTELTSLSIDNPEVTDEGLEFLKGLANLQTLNLTGTSVTAEGVEELQKSLPDCTITFTSKEDSTRQ